MVAEDRYQKPYPIAGLFTFEIIPVINRKGEDCDAAKQNKVSSTEVQRHSKWAPSLQCA